MSIEVFDQGSTKAAGFVGIGATAAASVIDAIGIRSVSRQDTGLVVLELVEALAADEFQPTAVPSGHNGIVVATWIDDTHIRLETFTHAGVATNANSWFVFRQVRGKAACPITQAPG